MFNLRFNLMTKYSRNIKNFKTGYIDFFIQLHIAKYVSSKYICSKNLYCRINYSTCLDSSAYSGVAMQMHSHLNVIERKCIQEY